MILLFQTTHPSLSLCAPVVTCSKKEVEIEDVSPTSGSCPSLAVPLLPEQSPTADRQPWQHTMLHLPQTVVLRAPQPQELHTPSIESLKHRMVFFLKRVPFSLLLPILWPQNSFRVLQTPTLPSKCCSLSPLTLSLQSGNIFPIMDHSEASKPLYCLKIVKQILLIPIFLSFMLLLIKIPLLLVM